jgi:hypothetical protein
METLRVEMLEARRRFRLHIVWAGVCATVAIVAYIAGVVACAVSVVARLH